MHKWLPLVVTSWLLAANSALHAQLPPAKAEATFTVSPGLDFKLWAAEPLLVNPTTIDIDHKGRVWVAEAVNYRRIGFGRPILRPEGDRIVILEDSKGTGRADKATVFYQGKELYGPMGIAVAKDAVGPGYKVFVCQSPDILLFEDKEGKGKADGPPKKFLSGFRGFDHDHGVHGISIGPDGKLYFSVGDQGVDGLKSTDGKGRVWKSNGTDCRAGTIWKCDLDGTHLELIAHNFRNEYEPCVDSFGTVFVSDNDDDGNQQTRICYVMPGGNYGYHPRGPGESHWHEEKPGVVPKILRTYFGSPTGMCVYEGTLLPKQYQGQLLHTDAGPRHVRCYHLKPEGAGYAVEREDMVTSTDNWFRPSDIKVAPDGSVFVADWYDPGVGGHGMGDWTRGRIYRLAPKGHQYTVPKVDVSTDKGIVAALGSPCNAVRYVAMDKIRRMPHAEAVDVIASAVQQQENAVLRARALWQLGVLMSREAEDNLKPTLMWLGLLGDDKTAPEFRQLILRIENDFKKRNPAKLAEQFYRRFADSPAAAGRRELLLLMRDADPSVAKERILELAKKYDGKDVFYLKAIGIAVGTDPKRREVILADFDKHFPDWNEKTANLIFELRPPSVLPRLEKQVTDPKTPSSQRGQIVDILAASDDLAAGKSLLRLLAADAPAEVTSRVLANLKQFLPGKWRGLRGSPELTQTVSRLLEKPATSPTGLALIAAAERQEAVAQVAGLAEDAKQPTDVRREAVRTLGALHTPAAVTALEKLTATEALAAAAAEALGVQIAVRNAEKQPFGRAAAEALQKLVRAKDGTPAVRTAALSALAGSRTGTVWLLDQRAKKQLPEALVADAGRLLRNSPYPDLRNRALIAFPAPGKIDPKKLPDIAVLARRTGDAGNGKRLLTASLKGETQCLKCHMVRGIGGSIGPDLSMIGKKASKENLLESILYPSKAIADQYINWRVETMAGQVLNGLLVKESDTELILRDANGKDIVFARKDIESKKKLPDSLMPNDIVGGLSADELVDLVEYLYSLKTPALTFDRWDIVGPFDNGEADAGLDKVFEPEKKLDLSATYAGKSGPVKWRSVKPNGEGYVDLQAFFGPNSNQIVSYLTRTVESPADQEATIMLGTDDGGKLFVNGELVHTNREHLAAAPERHVVKVKLKKGANAVLLKIVNGDGAHGFYLTIVSEQELKAK